MPDESSARQTDIVVITVIIVVVLLIAVMVPSFVKSPRTGSQNACINNLRMIDAGKEQAALAEKWTEGTSADDLSNKAIVNMYLKGNTTPECPLGGRYRYNPIGTNPTCTIMSPTSHRLPVGI